MALALSAQRCLNHSTREAVARCPECGGFFCRECVTEHDDRVICSACLRRISAPAAKKRRNFAVVARPLQFTLGLLVAWLFFYFAGRVLVSIPASFHEGTLWKTAIEGND